MSRTQSQGIDYFPMAVDFFSDTKVKILKSRFGADGVAIYIYILCQLYREGYYTRADEDFIYITSDDLGMSPEKVNLVLNFLLERSMFDKQLFKADKVLTGPGIQERWQNAVSVRAQKTPMRVDARYWLLNGESTRPFIKVIHFQDCSEKKDNNSEKNIHYFSEETPIESKVKNSNNIPPISPQEKGGGDDRSVFFQTYPKLKPLKRYDDREIDYSKLLFAFSQSDFLRKRYSMKWVYENYGAIVGGEFGDDKVTDFRTAQERAADDRGARESWYSSRRQAAEDAAEKVQRRVAKIKGYSENQKRIGALEIMLAKSEVHNGEDATETKALAADLKALYKQRTSLLASIGLTEDDLKPKYSCPNCSDTGYLQDFRPCDCYKRGGA